VYVDNVKGYRQVNGTDSGATRVNTLLRLSLCRLPLTAAAPLSVPLNAHRCRATLCGAYRSPLPCHSLRRLPLPRRSLCRLPLTAAAPL